MLRPIVALMGGIALLGAWADSAAAQTEAQLLQQEDWAYQRLSALRVQHGCSTAASDERLNQGLPISRFSAAALLQACLPHLNGNTPELVLLLRQLEQELQQLDQRLENLEATQFSPTTKLKGLASLVLGGNRFAGSDNAVVSASRSNYGATTFNYDLKLYLDTSFTGQDLLRARLRGGNFDRTSNSFYGAGPSRLSILETAFQEQSGPDNFSVNRLYYQFPLGKGFTASFGPRVGQLDLFALRPSLYPAETILDLFTLKGAPAAYNFKLGAGAGLWWQSPGGFSVSANYVAGHGRDGNPSQGGIGTADSASTGSVQLAYRKQQWAAAAVVSSVQNLGGVIPYATNFTLDSLNNPGQTMAFGLSGYWQPRQSGWVPSISAGWGFNRTHYTSEVEQQGLVANSQSWSVGLQWQDAFAPGNALGMAVGQPIFATSLYGGETPRDGNYAWEWWYKLQLSDKIAVTPALFLLSRPLGAETTAGETFRQIGALLKTTLHF
jgi:hypothetical protein